MRNCTFTRLVRATVDLRAFPHQVVYLRSIRSIFPFATHHVEKDSRLSKGNKRDQRRVPPEIMGMFAFRCDIGLWNHGKYTEARGKLHFRTDERRALIEKHRQRRILASSFEHVRAISIARKDRACSSRFRRVACVRRNATRGFDANANVDVADDKGLPFKVYNSLGYIDVCLTPVRPLRTPSI